MRAVRAARQTGTSAPSASDRPGRSTASGAIPHRRQSARSVAAASALPPPMPLATGRRLTRVNAAPRGVLPLAARNARAARRTRLSGSAASAAASGPSSVSVSAAWSAGAARISSPISAKTARLSSR
jgi:hypothetical protein